MGDRGNIVVKQQDGGEVYLYTHWGGTGLANDLQIALAKRWRWNDPAYLTRIIFDVMTTGDHGEETGYGISTSPPDNEHPYLLVDTGEQKVAFTHDVKRDWASGNAGGTVYTFEEYIAVDPDDLAEAFDR